MSLQWEPAADDPLYDWAIGVSPHARALKEFVSTQAAQPASILLIGERGLCQAELARALHRHSGQPVTAFRQLEPREYATNELFRELFNTRGTLFASEYDGLPRLLQQQLAAFLEEQRWRAGRGASTGPRVVIDAEAARPTAESKLTCDTVAALCPVQCGLKPLRERSEDIPYLARQLTARFARRLGKEPPDLTPEAWRALAEYTWPQNIAELARVLETALAQAPPPRLAVEALPAQIRHARLRTLPATGVDLAELVEDFERSLIETALRQTANVQIKAARLLGLRPQTLNMKLKRLAEKHQPPR